MSYIGFGLSNGEWSYLPIPKNASSAHRQMFRDARWQPVNYQNATSVPCYVPWRHPVDRWFSGAAQYAAKWKLDYHQLLDEVAAGRPLVLDKHTMPQTDYLLATIQRPVLRRLEDANTFTANVFDLELASVNVRRTVPRRDLVPIIEAAYEPDLEAYWSIPVDPLDY